MAAGFRRRLTALTVPTRASLLRRTRHRELSYSRVRCNSLPGRFHPAVAGLHESASALIGWTEAPAPAQAASPAWLGAGAAHLGQLLAGLADLLHHPQAQDPLRRRGKPPAPWTDRLLDDLLLLADAHACFRDAMIALRQLLADSHAALRRLDAARLAAAVRARRRSDRDLARLAATLRCLSHRSSSAAAPSDPGEAAVAEAVAAATCAAAAASAAIFAGLASASASSSSSRAMPSPLAVSPAKVAAVPVWWVADLLRWRRRTVAVAASESGPGAREVPLDDCCSEEEEERQAAMERLRRLEECVAAAEDGCEQVYRALVNARVSLLNVLTPCF
ncbi:hypothetical protein BS78_01G492300 [Paspalum vaginatum]|nr:hypothetical protein BS78_01G492300 [Paspalum vaginatum]